MLVSLSHPCSPSPQFSVFSSRTAARAARRLSGDGGSACGLSKVEFMEKVQQSNEACQRGDFQEAVHLYTNALRADPQNCILYSNRSAAYLRLGQYATALDDAIKARVINPKWPKVSRCERNVAGELMKC